MTNKKIKFNVYIKIIIIIILTLISIFLSNVINNDEWETEKYSTNTSSYIINREKDMINIAYAEYRQKNLNKDDRNQEIEGLKQEILKINPKKEILVKEDIDDNGNYDIYFLDTFYESEAKYIIRRDLQRIDIQKINFLPDDKIIEENTILKQTGDYKNENLTFLNTKIPRKNIESVIIQKGFYGKKLSNYQTFDISKKQNRKVLCWATDENLNGVLELHIASEKGNIVLNEDSSLLFAYIGYNPMSTDLKCVYGLNELDYRKVKKMNRTFYRLGYSKMQTIDFNPIDTTNVEEMEGMFEECGYKNLIKADFYTLDLRKAKNIKQIFKSLGFQKMEHLGLGHNSYNELYNNINNSINNSNNINVEEMFKDTGKNLLKEIEYNGKKEDFKFKFLKIINDKHTNLQKENFSNLTKIKCFDGNLDFNEKIFKEKIK